MSALVPNHSQFSSLSIGLCKLSFVIPTDVTLLILPLILNERHLSILTYFINICLLCLEIWAQISSYCGILWPCLPFTINRCLAWQNPLPNQGDSVFFAHISLSVYNVTVTSFSFRIQLFPFDTLFVTRSSRFNPRRFSYLANECYYRYCLSNMLRCVFISYRPSTVPFL